MYRSRLFPCPFLRRPFSPSHSLCLILFPSLIFHCPSFSLLFYPLCPRLFDPLGAHTPPKRNRSPYPGQFHIDCPSQSNRTRQKTKKIVIYSFFLFFSIFFHFSRRDCSLLIAILDIQKNGRSAVRQKTRTNVIYSFSSF